MMVKWALAGVAILAFTPVPAQSQGSKVTSAIELARQADRLKPGQWVWAPQIAPDGPVVVYVDLSRQVATIYRNGVRIGVSTVSTGKPGHETPTGVFAILQKDANHHSSKYNNAPMPYQERLTLDGVALHAGGLPGYPESHGCVHLPLEFSRLLFGQTHMGGTVIVAGRAGSVHLTSSAGVLAPQGEKGTEIRHDPLQPGEQDRWNPQASPSGPVTIVVSRADRRVVVLRNGIEIGRARADLPTDDFETHVLVYNKLPNGQPRWMAVGVPGHADPDASSALDTSILNQLRLPASFRTALNSVIVPGTSILVTQAPVLPDNSGKKMTVMASAAR